MSHRLLLDTDIGGDVDDALCLALALASPEIDLVGVTTIGVESKQRARIASKLLALGGRPELPVYAGCRVPLLGGDSFHWMGHEGAATLAPGEEPPIADERAVDAILRLSREIDGLEIAAIGPLTNLAVALAIDPDLAGSIRRLTIMGGHLRRVAYGGHQFRPGVDYNLCADPHASFLVLRSGIPTQLITADVTLQTWLTAAELERIAGLGTELARVLAAEIRAWTPLQNRIFGRQGCDMDGDNVAFLHDPLALACVYEPGFCGFEELEIETQIDPAGVLHTIERSQPGEQSFPMQCATSVDAPRFRAHFMSRLAATDAEAAEAG